ncbi:MAG: hypothetical protein ABR947_08070 [Solirubrobacteraceae bacterium]|jgi:hypothetical protein
MADDLDGVIDSTGMARRTFMRRLVTGTVFATPVVASFAMAGVEAASAAAHDRYPGPPLGGPNQTIQIGNPNQPCGPQSPFANPNQTGQFGGGPPASDNPPPFFYDFGAPPQGPGSGH